MKKYKPYLTRVDLVKNQVERERIQEQEAKRKRKQRIQEQNRQNHLRYQEQLRSEMAARYFHSVISAGGESFSNKFSVAFDGINDRVEINRTLGSGYAELSISTWVKYNNNVATSNQYHPIVAKLGPSFGHSFQLTNMRSGASSNGGELYFNVHTPNGSYTALSGVIPSQNVWYNIVGTYDGSNVKIYIDGVLKGTTSASGNINSNTELMMLGDAGYGGYSQILNGNLDEVSIYSRGLTQSEVTNIYNSGTPNDVSTISNIEAYWRMGDGDTANTITDNVGSNNGTMVNMDSGDIVEDTTELISIRSIVRVLQNKT
jgi:hypothetical protein